MRYYLVAGEASGDLHGANLMKALKKKDLSADFQFYGGDKMLAEGGVLKKHYAEMAFMGFTEVILNLSTILKNLKACKADIVAYRPDVLILIDFPGFNLKIADFAKEHGIKVCYYISPKVWAWNQKRVLKIKKIVDRLFCILPFEVDFYKEWGMDVDYVGNPLLDEIALFEPDPLFKEKYNLQHKEVVALLPGSRKQEIERLLPDMLSIRNAFPDYHFVVAAAPSFDESYYQQFIKSSDVTLVFGQTYNLLNIAKVAVVASGTATLETALFHIPQVVVYRGGKISVAIARMLVKIRFISLVNLIMDREVVKELIQEDCNTKNITLYLKEIGDGEGRAKMLADYQILSEKMGTAGASERTADLIISYLKGDSN
ncbi:lipid-A-disaccharide synthase [Pedobacter frigoris]|uniref:lipid-A-disaccharide synthase n=1 Tax=Pedobacter frigoris TaxID=2571272 RepID=UPI00292CD237|nr:lipid-A-disaccharide synthase [Pedobacter frigoris]